MTTSPNFAARREAARERLATRGIAAMAVGPTSNMRYLLGYVPHPDERPCLLLLAPKGETLVVPDVNAEDVRSHVTLELFTYADEDGPDTAMDAALRAVGAGSATTVALDDAMRADFALLALARLGGPAASTASEVLAPMRMIKDEGELTRIHANAASADTAMEAAFAALHEGASETEVAAAARDAFDRAGALAIDLTIVGSGPNGAYPHHATGTRRIVEGDAVVIDLGASLDGYHSDITRMALVGTPPQGYEEVHGTVERAVIAALAAARPGARVREVDAAARQVIEEAGYGAYFPHRTGHGLGLDGHEPPFLTATGDTILEEGMVFSIEPGIYLPGRFGVRLEEIVALGADGPSVLSGLTREPFRAEAG